jgi:hypothetical protein
VKPGRRQLLLAALLAGLLPGGCGSLGGADVGQRTAEGGGAGRTITVDELDQITKSFADRYVLLLANACDGIKREAASPEQRRNAHFLKLSGATAAYDAATGPDPVKQLVDLAVIVELQKVVWVDEGQARRFFGEELGDRLSSALLTADEEVWQLCARAMRPEQIDVLREAIQTWRRANPGLEWISSVRFDVVAGGEGAPLVDLILGTLSAPSGAITDSVGQARLLGQRSFYYFKRLPVLTDWQAEAALENALAVPEANRIVEGASRVLESAAGVLARLDALASPSPDGDGDGDDTGADPRLHEIRLLLAEGRELAVATREAAAAISELMADRLPSEAATSLETAQRAGSSPFDVNEYTAAGAQFAQTLREATLLVHAARDLTESEEAMRRVEDVVDAATRGIARQHRETIDHTTWRVAQVVSLAAALILVCSCAILWWRSRMSGSGGRDSRH